VASTGEKKKWSGPKTYQQPFFPNKKSKTSFPLQSLKFFKNETKSYNITKITNHKINNTVKYNNQMNQQ